MENFLLPSKTQLEAMVALTQGAAGLIDAEARVLYLNTTLLGYSLDKVYGRSVLEGSHLDDQPRARQMFQQCLDQPDVPIHVQLRKVDTEGSTHVLGAVLLNKLNDPAIKAIVLQYRDITLEKATEAQNQYLASIVENSEDAIVSYDLKGVVQSWNRAAARIYGYSREEVVGKHVSVLLPASQTSEIDNIVRVISTGGRIPAHQSARRHKNGREVEVSMAVSPIVDGSGQVIGVSSVTRDISKPQRLSAARQLLSDISEHLSESLDYEKTIENVVNLVLGPLADCCSLDLLTDDGSLEHVALAHPNPNLFGRVQDLVRRRTPKPSADSFAGRVIAGGRPLVGTAITPEMFSSKDLLDEGIALARELDVRSFVGVPLKTRGRVLGVWSLLRTGASLAFDEHDLALINEVAARVALHIDNARLYRDALEASRLKDQFLATLSHELKTPLTSIAGWAAILKKSEIDPAMMRQALDSIQRNVLLQSAVVDDLLDVSRIVSGKMRLLLETANLPAIVDSAIENIRSASDAKSIELSVVTKGPLDSIICDPARIRQVVWNLLSNAIKFTPANGKVKVVLRSTDSGAAEIGVSDNGIGVSADFLPHIFDRFRQFDGSSTRTAPGLGLGLSIVKHLVELHGGTVHAESPGPGQGATFRVVLPRSLG